jgi:hypothetical protein
MIRPVRLEAVSTRYSILNTSVRYHSSLNEGVGRLRVIRDKLGRYCIDHRTPAHHHGPLLGLSPYTIYLEPASIDLRHTKSEGSTVHFVWSERRPTAFRYRSTYRNRRDKDNMAPVSSGSGKVKELKLVVVGSGGEFESGLLSLRVGAHKFGSLSVS